MVEAAVFVKLFAAFPGSFINHNIEFIAHREANEYFLLGNCETELDVKCKVLEWLSRGAHKTQPFHSNAKNEKFHEFMLAGINKYLGTDFSKDDIAIVYQMLGNRVRHDLTVAFVEGGYDMEILKEEHHE